ncbi:MAG: HAD family hydrolase [Candidatus Heimdallarchaeota archaeon]|nr:HAD family hydrolase [Candidatus Heimdallarchaeota archaeon]MCG3255653.1 HAD family hydrolase [Candidatus Heimdallarchaeota archaeon]MCK4610728.1 HAD family hydrolase [Candidatus Heimdallarchaeota archaeon]
MKSFQVVDTLFFDMDGTLTDLGKRWWEPFFRALDKLKPDHDREKRQEVLEKVLGRVMDTKMERSKFLKINIILKAIKDSGLSLRDVFKALKLVRADPLAFKEIVPLEGVEEVLSTLQSRGYKMALVTNAGDKTVARAKKKLTILNSFNVLVTRNTVKRIKPDPEPLLYACKALNKHPETCVMIGDFPQDIQAGKATGTKTVAILGVNAKYTKENIRKLEPDVTISSIGELLPLFLGPPDF